MKKLTYREQIQALVDQINHIYEAAGNLRDCASSEEKQYWNETRKIFYDASIPLRKLDNSLTQASANELLNDYSTFKSE